MAGANDGQFHVFRTLDGLEELSFIPSNLMPKLQYLAHSSNPTTLTHQYFVDGPTLLPMCGLEQEAAVQNQSVIGTRLSFSRKGVLTGIIVQPLAQVRHCIGHLNTSCDSTTLNNVYATPYKYFCGYWAFHFTNTLNPSFEWLLSPTAAQAQ